MRRRSTTTATSPRVRRRSPTSVERVRSPEGRGAGTTTKDGEHGDFAEGQETEEHEHDGGIFAEGQETEEDEHVGPLAGWPRCDTRVDDAIRTAGIPRCAARPDRRRRRHRGRARARPHAARPPGHAGRARRVHLGHDRPPPRAAALGRALRRERPRVGRRVHRGERDPARGSAPGSFEENDGLFVALTDEDMEYYDDFVEGCKECGIPIAGAHARTKRCALEPTLNPALKAAVRVPDATMDAMRMPLRFFATAKHGGATLYNYMEVARPARATAAPSRARSVRDHVTGTRGRDPRRPRRERDRTVVARRSRAMAGVDVPIRPSPGVMLALRGRLCNMVINRMHRSGDGDIVVPQRALSVVGTSSWTVEDPDELDVPEDHVRRMWAEGAKLIPAVAHAEFRAAWSAARPLIGRERGGLRPRAVADVQDDRPRRRRRRGVRDDHRAARPRRSAGWRSSARTSICREARRRPTLRPAHRPTLPHTAFYAETERRLA